MPDYPLSNIVGDRTPPRQSHPSQATMEGRAWVAFWGGVSFSPSTPLGYSSQASASGRK